MAYSLNNLTESIDISLEVDRDARQLSHYWLMADRNTAANLLKHSEPGTFLLRRKTRADVESGLYLVITAICLDGENYETIHMNVYARKEDKRIYYRVTEALDWRSSLSALIEHHRENPLMARIERAGTHGNNKVEVTFKYPYNQDGKCQNCGIPTDLNLEGWTIHVSTWENGKSYLSFRENKSQKVSWQLPLKAIPERYVNDMTGLEKHRLFLSRYLDLNYELNEQNFRKYPQEKLLLRGLQ